MNKEYQEKIKEIIKQISKHTRNMKRDETKVFLLKIKYDLNGILAKEKGDSND